MSVAEFSRSYDGIRHLPADVNKLERIGTKTEICKLFCAAIIALNKADETICKQADSLLATNSELLKQCALTRSNYSDQSSSSSSTVNHPNDEEGKSYSNVVKSLVIKPINQSVKFNNEQVQRRVEEALRQVAVNSTRLTKQGNLV